MFKDHFDNCLSVAKNVPAYPRKHVVFITCPQGSVSMVLALLL